MPDPAEPCIESAESAAETDRSFSELFGELAKEIGTLVRQELVLAADEMTQKARQAGRSAILVGVGTLLGAVSVLVLAGGLVLALGSALPMWLSAVVMALVIGGAAYLAFQRGTSALRCIELLPTETLASLGDDRIWAKDQIEATREQMSTTLGEVRRRLRPPPVKRKPSRTPARRKTST